MSAGAPREPAALAEPIQPWLLEILACPQCRSPLRLEEGDAPELACTGPDCGLVYSIDDGVPVLLVDEARRRPESGA